MIKPFQYYKTPDSKRGFLLVDIVPVYSTGAIIRRDVILLEFGKEEARQGVRYNIVDFEAAISTGKMILFTPKAE